MRTHTIFELNIPDQQNRYKEVEDRDLNVFSKAQESHSTPHLVKQRCVIHVSIANLSTRTMRGSSRSTHAHTHTHLQP